MPPRGWIKLSQPPTDHTILLRIGLFQENFSELERHLYEVSDPSHPRYGQHLSKEEVEALVAPNQDSLTIVDEWLASLGIGEGPVTRSPAKDWVNVKVSIRVAEEMLNTVHLSVSVGTVPKSDSRNTMSGSMLRLEIDLCEPRIIVFPDTFTSTSM